MNVLTTSSCKNFTRAADVEIPGIYFRKFKTGIEDLDNAFGGQGFLPGSVMMLAATAGVGKSTLALQLLQSLEDTGKKTAYISGEETIIQISLAARRVCAVSVPVANLVDVEDIEEAVIEHGFDFIVIDSFPTISTKKKGLKSKEKESYIIGKLVKLAKEREVCMLIIQHCTKDGNYKGGTELLHAIDAHFALARNSEDETLRDLTGHKNRFGACVTTTFSFGSEGYNFDAIEAETPVDSPKKSKKTSKREVILSVLDTPKTIAGIVRETNVNGSYLTTLMRELVTEGVVSKDGKGANATYVKV
jgi:predicted ATP-dependent serine protease